MIRPKSTQAYANELRKALDWNRYATLLKAIGPQLNSRKERFDKSDIIEQSLEVYTRSRLLWHDAVSYDHLDVKYDMKIEFKYGEDLLYYPTKRTRKTVILRIKNSFCHYDSGVTINNPADYYILGQQDAMFVLSYKELKPYLHSVPDGIKAYIPIDSLYVIFTPKDVELRSPRNCPDYRRIKLETQRKLIESI